MKIILQKPDTFGVLASTLCMLHCLGTPLIFIAHASTCCSITVPLWWQWIDYFFLIISFFAVYHSTKTTSNTVMKPLLWISWIALFITIINEKLKWLLLPEITMYVVALILVGLHIYNLNYCQCKTDICCTKMDK